MEIDKEKIRKKAVERIKEGKSKQEVYEELSIEFKNRKEIAEIIRFVPYEYKLKKYNSLNTAYLILLIVITLLTFIKITLGAIWLIWLIYIVASKKFKLYYWNSILGGVYFISGFFLLILGNKTGESFSYVYLSIALLISLIFIFFVFNLSKSKTCAGCPKVRIT